MDEIDAIGGRRFSEGTSADREIQRTLMELLNQLDGFDQLGKVLCLSCHCHIICRNTAIQIVEISLMVIIFYLAISGQNDHGN